MLVTTYKKTKLHKKQI